MIHNDKREFNLKNPKTGEIVTIIGEGWCCSACKISGGFPDDVDCTKETRERFKKMYHGMGDGE